MGLFGYFSGALADLFCTLPHPPIIMVTNKKHVTHTAFIFNIVLPPSSRL
jgi:hypothetical protein